MFDKFKQLKQLRDLQKTLNEERVEIEKEGIRLVMSGKLEVIDIFLNPELDKETQERVLKECFNEAVRKVQMSMASKFSNMPDFGL